jgi:hypothetical protein
VWDGLNWIGLRAAELLGDMKGIVEAGDRLAKLRAVLGESVVRRIIDQVCL